MSGLSTTPPQMDILTSPKDRRQAGVASAYADTYNQSQMAKYNNEYNYWLWQQQMEYNSPQQQRARLEAAGLNPNYNSVDTGNVSSIPSSSGSLTPSIGKNTASYMQAGLQGFNALIGAIGQGIEDVSKISGIPKDIGTYRQMLSDVMGHQRGIKEVEKVLKRIQAAWSAHTELGIDLPFVFEGVTSNGDPWLYEPNWDQAQMYRNLGLRNSNLYETWQSRLFERQNLLPSEQEKLQKQVEILGQTFNLNEKQLEWFNALAGTKVGSMLMPILVQFIKQAIH